MNRFDRSKRGGFTIAEVLIVVAIISILLTVAIPGVITYARRLELVKLDDSARSIFMAAQNRLTAMKNAGEELGALAEAANGGKVTFITDSPFATGHILYAKKGGDGGIDRIVPGGSIEPELFSNCYVVEFDPDNGAVFAVWYWEEGKYTFDGQEYLNELPDREKRIEKGAVVGYYGGTLLEDRPDFDQMPIPHVTLTNAEELRLEINVPVTAGLTGKSEDILVEVKVNGKTIIKDANIGNGETGTVMLDTLKKYPPLPALSNKWVIGDRFENWATDVTPGEDIEVSVTLSYRDGSLIPHTVYAHTNSLFAKREGDTVYIACGRHLQNLKYVAALDPLGNISAVQTGDIDFEDDVNVKDIWSWKETYTDGGVTRKFEPIYNPLVRSYTYDGGGHSVSNLDAFSANGDAGLFANAAGEIRDLRLIDARAAGSANAGALVGEVGASQELTVTDCQVYLTGPYSTDTMVSGSTAGGLVGKADGTLTIENSFASTVVEGAVVGGLVGDAGSAAKVDHSYAAGYLKGGTGGTVGGIAGRAGNITVSNSYAAGEIASGGTVGGILAEGVANISDGTAAGDTATYAAVYYGEDVTKAGTSATVYGTFPGDDGADRVKYAYEAGGNFVADSGDNSLEALEAPAEGTAVPYNMVPELALTNAYSYGRVVKDLGGGLLPHYGDWLNAQPGGIELAYYEKYLDKDSNESWGFYSVKISNDGKAEIARNSLHNAAPGDGVTVVRDGYVVLSPTAITDPNLAENADISVAGYKVYNIDTSSVGHVVYTTLEVNDGEDHKFIYNPYFACEAFDLTDAPADFDYSNWLSKPGSVSAPGSGSAGNATAEVLIRSARQLNNLSAYTNDGTANVRGWKFSQTVDIDYSKYEFDAVHADKYGQETNRLTPVAFGSGMSYNGRGYLIENLWMDADAWGRSGLFGAVAGSVVQNVTLVNVNAEGTGDTGALVGLVSGGSIISKCGAYVSKADQYERYTVTSTGGYAGGLIGHMQNADVRSCFASVRVRGNMAAGGFVGAMTDYSANSIDNGYAGGRTEGGGYTGGSVNVYADGTAPAGGFVGLYDKGSFSGTVYSTCSVGNNDSADDTRGLFAGSGDVARSTILDVFYATGEAFSDAAGAMAKAGHRTETNILTGAALPTGKLDAANTFNYDEKFNNKRFPFASSTGSHHGDWKEQPMAGIYYWEKENDEYNFYVFIWDGEKSAVEDGLCRKHACSDNVEAWGYGVFGVPGGRDRDTDGKAQTAKEKFVNERAMVDGDLTYTLASGSAGVVTTVNLGSSFAGKELVCDMRCGAAIEEKENELTLRREIRALDQLENVSQEETLAFTQTHDIDAKGNELGAALVLSGADARYDGGFYRILNLKIEKGPGDAALFDLVENGATVENVILYAPDGNGTINGANAAGIAAKVNGGNVDSCVVAGYTISGTGSIGGIAASVSGASAISSSEATVTLKSTNIAAEIGGLVGKAESGLTVTESYAGGYIDTRDGSKKVQNVGSIGGIVGTGSDVTYDSVYSYVDMTDAMTIEDGGKHHVYGIGPGTVAGDSRISEYWYAGLSADPKSGSNKTPVDTADTDANIAGVTLAQLKNDGQKMGASAEELYIPVLDDKAAGLLNHVQNFDYTDESKYERFPFAAYVTNDLDPTDIRNIHYGDIPSSAYAGIFYYEKEEITRLVNGSQRTETVYNFYAYGGEIYKSALRGERLLDGLCYDHHLNGERAKIVESGYGYFYPSTGDDGVTYTIEVNGDPVSSTEKVDEDPIRTNLLSALAVNGEYRVWLMGEEGNVFKTKKWALKAEKNGSGIGDVTMYVNQAFGAVISDDIDFGKGNEAEDDRPDNYAQVRTCEQLRHVIGVSAHTSGSSPSERSELKFYAVTHDIDMKGEVWIPGKLACKVFDGRGYKILDLKVDVDTGDAALFNNTGSNVTIKNLILYSPDGKGVISTKGTDGNAGGIVSTAGSSLKITNCVVSGYTITGTRYVGGIIGVDNRSDRATIENCQATNTVTGNGADAVGGIAGYCFGKIDKCVSGGSVSMTTGGGKWDNICGDKATSAVITGCYTTIGLDPGNPDRSIIATDDTKADYAYIPNRTDAFDGLSYRKAEDEQYPYLTYVKLSLDPNNDAGVDTKGDYPAHYGDWPRNSNVAGVMYYEVDENNAFTYHFLGLYSSGDVAEIHGGLCGERHVDENGVISEHRIVKSGYALINMIPGAQFLDDSDAVTEGLPGLVEGSGADIGGIKNQILNALYPNSTTGGGSGDVIKAVYPTPDEGSCDSLSINVSAGGEKLKIFYTKGFADVSQSAFGSTDQSSGHVHPFYIRTVRQLDNIPDNVEAVYSFVIGHDLYGKEAGTPVEYYTGYTGAEDFRGSLDGQSYKVLDLQITTGDDVGLIASTGSGARLSNIIVYSTDETSLSNDPAATLSGVNVGALVGRAAGSTTITNCASASHVISGTGSLGGLVGSCDGSTLMMENCEAACLITVYDDTTGNINAGGLVGDQGNDVSIVNCYAGGKIITPANPNGRAYNVGGLVGGAAPASGKVAISGSYSYANLLEAYGENVYAVGNGVEVSDSVQYLTPYVSEGVTKTADQGVGTGVFMLAEAAAGSRAKWSYKAKETPILEGNNGYHFRAVITVDGKLEHYGPWPGMAGLMYWEISVIDGKDTFKYHFIGMDEFGNPNDYSTLCTSHHTTADGQIKEHVIKTSGYAMINTCEATVAYNTSSTFTDIENTRQTIEILEYTKENFDKIKDSDPVADEAIYTMTTLMGFNPERIGLTAKCNNATLNATDFYVNLSIPDPQNTSRKKTVKVYCTYGLAEVSNNTFGKDADHPYIIRTVQQLKNMDTTGHLTGTKYYLQTHDIFGKDTTDFKPIGALTKHKDGRDIKIGTGFQGEYNGNGYRILELDIHSASNRAGLFWQTDSSTVKNVIMYSPSGNAKIIAEFTNETGDPDSLNAGGITADSTDNAVISNCVVAGYTIQVHGTPTDSKSHDHYLGGIAAWFRGSIEECQAVVNLEDSAGGGKGGRAFIGGIVGGTNGTAITGCYAGGLINRTADLSTAGGTDPVQQLVGGIVGAQEANANGAISKCFSYMDMSDLIGDSRIDCKLYSISSVDTDSGVHDPNAALEILDCYYWKGGIYGAKVQRGDSASYNGSNRIRRQVTGVTFEDLGKLFAGSGKLKDAFPTVTNAQTFVPENVKHLEGVAFPYGTTTVEIDGVPTPVHYGMWPQESPAVGAAYYEYELPYGVTDEDGEENGAYRYQGFGFSVAETDESFDNLCTSFGGGDTRRSGFVYFYLEDRAETGYIPKGSAGFTPLPDNDPHVTSIRDSLRNVFGKYYHVVVFENAATNTGDVTWEIYDKNEGRPKSKTVAFDPRFAKMYEAGSAANGSEDNPYIVRNINQFRNIDGMENKYIEQTHDFECTGSADYKPMTVSGINYKGHVHSIRNLSIDAGASSAALFASVKDSTFDGLVLDAPLADNPDTALIIKTTGDFAAGIAAETTGTCTFTRCAVAGYDITSRNTVGGIVGVNNGDLTLERCQTVYNPMGTGEGYLNTIGGLVGKNSGELTINNAYAGGKIFKMTAAKYDVGGLVGLNEGSALTIDHSFCYMDMSDLEHDGVGKRVYAIASSGVDWDTCGYIARGLPAWATFTKGADGSWVKSDTLGYGHGKTLFDSKITGFKEGDTTSTEYDVSESLGTWLRKQQTEGSGWELGYPEGRTPADFPFMAVISYDADYDPSGKTVYAHFGHTRYQSFGTRPYIGFFQVYGTSGGEARLNPNRGPYYAFGWVRDVNGVIGTSIPNNTPTASDDTPALDDNDMNNLGRITRTGSDGAKAFMTNRATSYGLLLPKGYTIKDTGITVPKSHEDKAYDKYVEGGETRYIPWVEHNYQVYDTNGNIIIGDFYVEARDGKPFEIVLDGREPEVPSEELIPDPGSVPGRHSILADQNPKVPVENIEAFAAYDMYWFTTDSISGLYEDGDNPVSRSRTEFRLEFTFNFAEETIYILPDPSMGDYPMNYKLEVESNRKTVLPE